MPRTSSVPSSERASDVGRESNTEERDSAPSNHRPSGCGRGDSNGSSGSNRFPFPEHVPAPGVDDLFASCHDRLSTAATTDHRPKMRVERRRRSSEGPSPLQVLDFRVCRLVGYVIVEGAVGW